MANYPIHRIGNSETLLGTTKSFYSDEYAECMCDLHLRDEIHKEQNGTVQRYYRLHAKHPHTIEMALRYDIHCPKCSSGMLKQVGRCRNSHELGLYICPVCENDRQGK